MNIVKLRDIVMPEEFRLSKFFNKNLKGKYAYWVQMRYIFPLESLDYRTYIRFEQLDAADFLSEDMLPHIDLYSEDCCMYDFAQNYIDQSITESINDINEYRIANEYVVDFNVDITHLRSFRTWLANEVLLLNSSIDGVYNSNLSDNQIHMLEFYQNNMYNDIIKQLSIFGVDNNFKSVGASNTCGCCSPNTTLDGLSLITICKPIEIYTKNLHNLMVQTFEDVNFWAQFNVEFIKLFKLYIDNIIKAGFVITASDVNKMYVSCDCGNSNLHTTILQNLSTSLGYIINNDIANHRNFIHDSLYNWAEKLYDYMYWK